MNHFYDGQIRRVLTQFMRLMACWSYKDSKGKITDVPVRYGDMNRQVASIINQNSENVVQAAPFIACYIKSIQYDRQRLQDPTFISKLHIREREYDIDTQQYLSTQGAGYTVERIMPSPYVITFAADIWTTNLDQKLQLFEQISSMFNPSMEIQMTDNYIDWTSLSTLELLPESQWETRSVPQGVDTAISVTSLVFSAPIWISPPAKVKKLGIITKIIANVFAEPPGFSEENVGNAQLGDIFSGQTPQAQVVIAPGDFELLVLDNQASLLPVRTRTAELSVDLLTTENRVSWRKILQLYPGSFTAGLSQLRLIRPDGFEVVARISLDPNDETIMNLTLDPDTVPTNTPITDPSSGIIRGTIDAIIDPTTFNPDTPANDTRYLILEDINQAANTESYTGAVAWRNSDGSNFIANANDIISFYYGYWTVIFNSQATTEVTYITNSYTGIQYKWDGSSWTKSYEGVYDPLAWRLIL